MKLKYRWIVSRKRARKIVARIKPKPEKVRICPECGDFLNTDSFIVTCPGGCDKGAGFDPYGHRNYPES